MIVLELIPLCSTLLETVGPKLTQGPQADRDRLTSQILQPFSRPCTDKLAGSCLSRVVINLVKSALLRYRAALAVHISKLPLFKLYIQLLLYLLTIRYIMSLVLFQQLVQQRNVIIIELVGRY